MISRIASSVFKLIPENQAKQQLRALVHRARYKEYKTFFRNGVWELHYPDFILRYKDVPSPATVNYLFFKRFTERDFDIVIDAGGFMGTYGFLMAKKFPKAKIFIFEADPDNYERIKANLSLNDLPNVVVEPVGLWSQKDVLKMSVSSDLASSIVNEKSDARTVEIPVVCLDEYFTGVSGKTVFIKMNIEGAEIAALEGAKNFIDNNKVECSICTDHFVDGELTYKAVEQIFASHNMPFETLRDGIYINTYSGNISR